MSDYNAQEMAGSIRAAWSELMLRDQSSPSKREYTYASSYQVCDRRMVLEMTHGDCKPGFDAETYARFRRGNDRERDLISDLMQVSRLHDPPFDVVSQQERFELRDRKGRVCIVGKVDARLSFSRSDSFPLEVKSWNQNMTAGVDDFEDLFQSRWMRSGAYQLLSYLLGSGEELGFLLLDRPGIPTLIFVELSDRNLDRAEEFLEKAERALDHKEAGTLPDFVDDQEECEFCPFYGSQCQPPMKYEGVEIVEDPEIEKMLERRAELEPAKREYFRLDKKIKDEFRGVKKVLCGNFILRGSWGKKTSYDYPDEVKEKYRVVDPEGRFLLKVETV